MAFLILLGIGAVISYGNRGNSTAQPDSTTATSHSAIAPVVDTTAEQFLQIAEGALKSENFSDAKMFAEEFLTRHSDHTDTARAHQISRTADSGLNAIAAQQKLKEATEAREQARLTKALASMTKKLDRVQDITFYQDRSAPRYLNSRNWIGAYIAAPNGGGPYLRFVIYYVADEWLFLEDYDFLIDGSRYNVSPSYGQIERDNETRIWEWYDAPAKPSDKALLETIAGSKEAVLRYNGRQYRRDRTITASEKAAIRRVLDAYEALGGN